MASFTNTIQTPLLALQSLAAGAVVMSSPLTVDGKLSGVFSFRFGRRHASTLTLPLIYRLETSMRLSGDGNWVPVAGCQFTTNVAATAGDQAVNGTCAAGQNVVPMTATAGFTVGAIVFIDNPTIANSEYGRVKAVTTDTSITLERNLVNAQTGSHVYTDAQIFTSQEVIFQGMKRVQAVANGAGCAQATAVEVEAITCDSIG